MESYIADLKYKITAFICCFVIYLCQGDFEADVVTVIVSIIFGAFLSYFDDGRLKTALCLGFISISCFSPEFMVFMPLMVFDMLFYRYQYYNLLIAVPLIVFYNVASLQLFSTVSVILLLSAALKYSSHMESVLKLKYNRLWDTAREMSIRLEKQKEELIEKQDFELNIATLNERNRIAREIHDNVGHLLSSAILQSGALITTVKDENMKKYLVYLKDTLSRAMDSIRESVHNLHEESVDLKVQIEELIRNFTFCNISLEYGIYSKPEKKIKYCFIAVIKEALSNIMKHSDATEASVIAREHPAFYQLIVRDNGKVKDFDPDKGLGIRSMIDRVNSLNGNINIMTENGFEIFISVPRKDTV